MVTLESLIEEGTNIREGIKYIPTVPGVVRMYKAFSLPDTKIYGTWKSKVIRYLDKNFSGDRCISDFENAIAEFEKHHCDPSLFDVVNGILISCQEINDDEKQEKESVIDKIYRLEADYEKRASSINGINKLETIKAFHDWYDATLRYLGQFFDEKNAVFKKISTIQTGGNGHTLKFVFDEITDGMDSLLESKVVDNLLQLVDKTIVFVTHGMDAVKRFCTRAVWLHQGVIRRDGLTDEVIDAYEEVFNRRLTDEDKEKWNL